MKNEKKERKKKKTEKIRKNINKTEFNQLGMFLFLLFVPAINLTSTKMRCFSVTGCGKWVSGVLKSLLPYKVRCELTFSRFPVSTSTAMSSACKSATKDNVHISQWNLES